MNDAPTAALTCRLYRARRVITMTERDAEAFAVLGDRVVGVGSADGLAARFPDAERVDLGDAVVTPGFNDAHQHLSMTAEDVLHLDLSPAAVGSVSEITARVAREAAQLPAGRWIRGSRYDNTRLTERRAPTRAELDEVAPDHPVLLTHISVHGGVVNSAALRAAGIDDDSQPPQGGVYGRDAAGRLDGSLVEQALFDVAFPAMSPRPVILAPAGVTQRLDGLRRAVGMFHAAGITSVGDAMIGPDELALYQEADRLDALDLRVNLLVTHHHFDHALRLGLRSGFGNDRLRFGGVKAFVDGAVSARTCLVEEPFEESDDHGMQTTSRAELRDVIRTVHEAGSRLAIHANGDRAIGLVLDELEAADAALPRPGVHHRIEHCSIVTDELVARIARLGVIAVPFGSYVAFHGEKLLAWYGQERLERMFAHRALLDAGVRVAGSSDYPCGPYQPLHAMQSCVTRQADGSGAILGGSQRISAREALALYTTGAAFASGEEHIKGRLAPGQLADFTVLGDDPLEVDPTSLAQVAVLATYLGGEPVWTA